MRPIGSKSCPDLGPVGPIGSAAYASDSPTLATLANVHGNSRDDQKVNFGLPEYAKSRLRASAIFPE
jgi:hypothetical protein